MTDELFSYSVKNNPLRDEPASRPGTQLYMCRMALFSGLCKRYGIVEERAWNSDPW
jgi:hypothetical protein